MRKRLPRVIRLPGGFTITVKQRKCPDSHGYWSEYSITRGTGILVINKDDDLADKWHYLGHEFIHAANDYAHFLDQTIVRPLQIEMGETLHALEED